MIAVARRELIAVARRELIAVARREVRHGPPPARPPRDTPAWVPLSAPPDLAPLPHLPHRPRDSHPSWRNPNR